MCSPTSTVRRRPGASTALPRRRATAPRRPNARHHTCRRGIPQERRLGDPAAPHSEIGSRSVTALVAPSTQDPPFGVPEAALMLVSLDRTDLSFWPPGVTSWNGRVSPLHPRGGLFWQTCSGFAGGRWSFQRIGEPAGTIVVSRRGPLMLSWPVPAVSEGAARSHSERPARWPDRPAEASPSHVPWRPSGSGSGRSACSPLAGSHGAVRAAGASHEATALAPCAAAAREFALGLGTALASRRGPGPLRGWLLATALVGTAATRSPSPGAGQQAPPNAL